MSGGDCEITRAPLLKILQREVDLKPASVDLALYAAPVGFIERREQRERDVHRLKVIGVSRTGRKVPPADAVHKTAALDRLLPGADYVILAVPLTPETRHLLSRARLDRMKPGAAVINIARAPVLDAEALADKLSRGELAGAVLDVVEPEPLPPESPLWDAPNLLITPHISCDDGEHYVDISLDLWFANFARFLEGKPLRNRVDSRRGY